MVSDARIEKDESHPGNTCPADVCIEAAQAPHYPSNTCLLCPHEVTNPSYSVCGAGKVAERRWYERNKHIFPASRWEVYDPRVSREGAGYTIHGGEVNEAKK
jgi:hypothetical protein